MKYSFLLYLLILLSLPAFGQGRVTKINFPARPKTEIKETKMIIEVWSDVVCPFCYVGKRKLEKALEQFPQKDNVQVVWKSFQLNPDEETAPGKDPNEQLAAKYGVSTAEAQKMRDRVAGMAKQVGLDYQMDKVIIANSFNAHRFAHFAKSQGKQDEAEELLFRAHFIDGKNIDDTPTLLAFATEIGLDAEDLKTTLAGDIYADDVQADIREAQQIGVQGVPFFVFDRKYAISGAQDNQVFNETLKKSFEEWQKEQP